MGSLVRAVGTITLNFGKGKKVREGKEPSPAMEFFFGNGQSLHLALDKGLEWPGLPKISPCNIAEGHPPMVNFSQGAVPDLSDHPIRGIDQIRVKELGAVG